MFFEVKEIAQVVALKHHQQKELEDIKRGMFFAGSLSFLPASVFPFRDKTREPSV